MENSLCVPRSCPLTNIVTIRADSCELLTVASSSCQEQRSQTWRLSAHESAGPPLQPRYPWPQLPNVCERDLRSHPDAERIGKCATLVEIGRACRGRRHAVALAGKNGPVCARRRRGRCPGRAKLAVLLFPCIHEHSGACR